MEGKLDAKTLRRLKFTDVKFFPIVKEYARKINLVDTINHMVGTQMELQPGPVVLAMVIDSLSGRSPLYRLKDFLEDKDSHLLLGDPVPKERFTDHNVGRVLDKLYETGAQSIFSQLSQNAVNGFELDTKAAHYDTTSVSVCGDYDQQDDPPFKITYGYSKDHRPDLKQFLLEMLCVDKNIPLLGRLQDGNASDKTLNNELLSGISKHMADHGIQEGAFVYVADSAFVTGDNLKKADTTPFLTRLPATYNECSRVITKAVQQKDWVDIGTLAETDDTVKRPAARYKVTDSAVELYGRQYRAVVVHSSAHDKRRHKKVERKLQTDRKSLEKACKKIRAESYFCEADAVAAAEKLSSLPKASDCFTVATEIKKVPKYPRGRPKKGEERVPDSYEYQVETIIAEDKEKTAALRQEAGCFVLLTNMNSDTEKAQWTPADLLQLYKNQSGIEQNFGFLKDPVIINSVFLKKDTRIEVLGMILLIALLIWRLMEKTMRSNLEQEDKTIKGWVNRQTKKPTSFMMTTKFVTVLIITDGNQRQLSQPLKPVQLEYLKALGVSPEAFLTP